MIGDSSELMMPVSVLDFAARVMRTAGGIAEEAPQICRCGVVADKRWEVHLGFSVPLTSNVLCDPGQ